MEKNKKCSLCELSNSEQLLVALSKQQRLYYVDSEIRGSERIFFRDGRWLFSDGFGKLDSAGTGRVLTLIWEYPERFKIVKKEVL